MEINIKNLPYDPVLKEAMEKIKSILDEYEVGGSVILSSKTHSEYVYIFPDWCIAQWNKTGDGIHITSKREEYKSKEEQHMIIEESTGFIARQRDVSAQSFSLYDKLMSKLEKYFEIKHKNFAGHTRHFDN